MIHPPIQLQNLCLCFPHKICFEHFNAHIHARQRIALMGRNGAGKSTLLKMLYGAFDQYEGEIKMPFNIQMGYVPQIIEQFTTSSGAQRFQQTLTKVLYAQPDILLLDEPTNHLDHHHKKALLRRLQRYTGTLIIASHDVALLRQTVDILWDIDNGRITIFSGDYDDYRQMRDTQRQAIAHSLSLLHREKKQMHQTLMKEQERAKKSDARGEKSIRERKWPTIVSDAKARSAIETAGKKKKAIRQQKEGLLEELAQLRLPEIITPTFSISSTDRGDRMLLSIQQGCIGYDPKQPVLNNIYLSLHSQDRIAITGDNGSGKSTFIKAILEDPLIIKSGHWILPKKQDIGYLDQHYQTLCPRQTVLESMIELAPHWSHAEIRRHLNDFLFRKNEEVNAYTTQLSGGEKARLSLAKIAAQTPKLLILDEMSNNIDLETRQHVIQVLAAYPGAMIIISHDHDFLMEIGINQYYQINDQVLEITAGILQD
jgi:ATPase subunit of ABC transporter with duplicated ATPase domains